MSAVDGHIVNCSLCGSCGRAHCELDREQGVVWRRGESWGVPEGAILELLEQVLNYFYPMWSTFTIHRGKYIMTFVCSRFTDLVSCNSIKTFRVCSLRLPDHWSRHRPACTHFIYFSWHDDKHVWIIIGVLSHEKNDGVSGLVLVWSFIGSVSSMNSTDTRRKESWSWTTSQPISSPWSQHWYTQRSTGSAQRYHEANPGTCIIALAPPTVTVKQALARTS